MAEVKTVRAVEGYEPKLTKIMDRNGRETLYLLVAERKEWFFRWCQANGKVGMLDDSEYTIHENAKLVVVTAKVIVDGAIVAKSSASRVYDPNNPDLGATPIQEAGTSALGRALANYGFSTANCAPDPEELKTLADAPVTLDQFEANPMMALITDDESQAPHVVDDGSQVPHVEDNGNQIPVQQSSATPPAAASKPEHEKDKKSGATKAPDIAPVNSVEEAYRAVLPVTGKKGNTLGLLWNTTNDKRMIYFIAGKGNRPFAWADDYPNLVHACKLIIGIA